MARATLIGALGLLGVLASPGASRAASGSAPTGQNPLGVMLPFRVVRSSEGIRVAKTLGAVYFRPPSIFLDEWNGICPECDIARHAGLQLVLTVATTVAGKPSPRPPTLAA